MVYNTDDAPIFVIDYLNYISGVKNRSVQTTKEYYYDLRTFLRFVKLQKGLVDKNTDFDSIMINDITIEHIRSLTLSDLIAFISYAKDGRKNSTATRARKTACLKAFYKYLANIAKLISVNPANDLEFPKREKKLPKYLDIEESKKLSSVFEGKNPERDHAIITLFLHCGLRVSELVSINIDSIKKNVLTVVGKGNKERSIPLNIACLEAIEAYMKVRPVDGVIDRNALFLSKRKQRISVDSVQMIVKKYLKLAGINPSKYSPHKLRHTFATLMYREGKVDILTLKKLLGHDDISTTEIYTHLESKDLEEAVYKNPLLDSPEK
jgi:site-specific recombinase XerD